MSDRVAVLACSLVLLAGTVHAASPARGRPSDARVAAAVARIRHSVDPCGDSAELVALLDRFQACRGSQYRIRTSVTAARNFFDRPSDPSGAAARRTIIWNPVLRSELERGCADDVERPVLRDPTASLLHELAHAVQDCEGQNPAEHEFEAVRLENVYRRAAGLCQRQRYGDDPLPVAMRKTCAPGACPCTMPQEPGSDPTDVLRAASVVDAPASIGDSVQRPGEPEPEAFPAAR